MEVKSYGKINIGLNVLYKRYDNYHELETIMVSVDLHDVLNFTPTTDDKIEVKTNSKFINKKDNIIYNVAKHLQETFNIPTGVEIDVIKNIPVAGGMAGGSSNAAATIKALNQLWDLNLDLQQQMEIGEKFGADIPFCINQSPAYVTGIGEIIEPFEFESNFNVIIVKMPFGLSTKKLFEMLDVSEATIYSIDEIKSALINQDNDQLAKYLGNSFEETSIHLQPEIKTVKDLLIEMGCFASVMTGSGPTVLGFIEKDKDATTIIDTINNAGYSAYLTSVIK